LYIGQRRSRSSESEFLFQGDIAMSKRDVIGIVNAGGKRRKRAVMKKLPSKLWQRNKLAYAISESLRSKLFVICP
jgi:hypothetical protein